MMVDLYSKVMLTIIAMCLFVIAVQGVVRDASADTDGIQRVSICDPITSRCARVGTVKENTPSEVEVLLTVDVK